uniref:Uncharacterized protein n=1 Tax=Oryza glumipatula TaxID=40148 RepID=A0A0E0ACT5_9ORYZ
MDLVRLRPSLLAARGPRCGLAAASPARNGKGPVSLSSQRTQGPSFDQCQKFFGWESSHHRIPHRPTISLLAVENLSDVSPLFLTGLLEAVVAALFLNIYIVGLYQLFDIEIDKPTLPLASVEYSPATGVALVSAFAAMVNKLLWSRK